MLSYEELLASNRELDTQCQRLIDTAKDVYATLRLNLPGQFRFTEQKLVNSLKRSMEESEFDTFMHYTQVRADAISTAIARENEHLLADEVREIPQASPALSFPDTIFQKINSITLSQKALAS